MGMDDNSNDRVKSKKISNADVRNASALRIRLNRMDSYVGVSTTKSTNLNPSIISRLWNDFNCIFERLRFCSQFISLVLSSKVNINTFNRCYTYVHNGEEKAKNETNLLLF